MTTLALAIATVNANAAPSGFSVGSGQVEYDTATNTLTYGQNNSVANFNSFNLNFGETLTVRPDGIGCDASCTGIAEVITNAPSTLDGTIALEMNFLLVNQNGIAFGNNFTLDLTALSASSAKAFIASTFNVTPTQAGYEFLQNGLGNRITVDGFTVLGSGGQVLLVSEGVDINGAVSVPNGSFNVAAGDRVLASLANNLIQVDITEALSSGQRAITVGRNGSVEAGEINLQARVSDPLSLAVNNRGVLRATGIDTGSGKITLLGDGGAISTRGAVIAEGSDAGITFSATNVGIQGDVDAGDGSINVAIGGDSNGALDSASRGLLRVRSATLNASSMTIEGRGGHNAIEGLANYSVTGLNSGTAGHAGVGGSTAANTGAITFNNVSRLEAQSGAQTFRVLSTGQLLSEAGGTREGSIIGSSGDDTFIIEGRVESLYGGLGNDTFVMNGGTVYQLIDGGAGAALTFEDRIIDVLAPGFDTANPESGGSINFSGLPNQVANWVEVERVQAFTPPLPVDVNLTQVSFAELDPNAGAGLGLVGGSEPRLPCGFNTFIPASSELIEAEEDCQEEQQYQQLMSSIIHFDNDSSAITAASADRLRRVSDFVVDSDIVGKVRIEGHTDDNASEAYNLSLSKRRAQQTADFMRERGVSTELMHLQYFGESLPMVANDSDENRALNRRAVIELEAK